MTEEKTFAFGSVGGAGVGEANLVKKVGRKRANELLSRIAEATMPKMKKGVKEMTNYGMKYRTNTGYEESVSLEEMFEWIYNDFVRSIIEREYTRGLLRDLDIPPTGVFHLMEMLGLAREEFRYEDYMEMQYV